MYIYNINYCLIFVCKLNNFIWIIGPMMFVLITLILHWIHTRASEGFAPYTRPHQGLCPWVPQGSSSGPLDPTQGSRARTLRASIFCPLRKRFLINGAPSHPLHAHGHPHAKLRHYSEGYFWLEMLTTGFRAVKWLLCAQMLINSYL